MTWLSVDWKQESRGTNQPHRGLGWNPGRRFFKHHTGASQFSQDVTSAAEFEIPQKASVVSGLSRRKQGFDSPRGRQHAPKCPSHLNFQGNLRLKFPAGTCNWYTRRMEDVAKGHRWLFERREKDGTHRYYLRCPSSPGPGGVLPVSPDSPAIGFEL